MWALLGHLSVQMFFSGMKKQREQRKKSWPGLGMVLDTSTCVCILCMIFTLSWSQWQVQERNHLPKELVGLAGDTVTLFLEKAALSWNRPAARNTHVAFYNPPCCSCNWATSFSASKRRGQTRPAEIKMVINGFILYILYILYLYELQIICISSC